MRINICHLYPEWLNHYGDRGNVLALAARCRWRGIEPVVRQISAGESPTLEETDILLLGGGSEREQMSLLREMLPWEEELQAAVNDDLVILAVGSSYQLLGEYLQTVDGERVRTLDIVDCWTIAGGKRVSGDSVIRSDDKTMVGFENHAGKTYLGTNAKPLGKVLSGHGNNGEDGYEGARFKNVFGTYLHGPLLPKNCHFADFLLKLALARRGFTEPLTALDDRLETSAHDFIVQRLAK